MSSAHTPSRNPVLSPNSLNPQSTSASMLPHPPSTFVQSPTSAPPNETSQTTQSAFLLAVDAVKAMQLFTQYLEQKIDQIWECVENQSYSFEIDIMQIQIPELLSLIVKTPDVIPTIGDAALRSVAQQQIQNKFDAQLLQNPELKSEIKELFQVYYDFAPSLRIKPINSPQKPLLRQLSPVITDQLISLQGLVTRKSQPSPTLRTAAFSCQNCHAHCFVDVSRGSVRKPLNCSVCDAPFVELDSLQCQYSGSVLVRIQEISNDQQAETPVSVQIQSSEEVFEQIQTGDCVEICGIFRLSSEKADSVHRAIKAVFRPFIEALSCRIIKKAGESNFEQVLERDNIGFQSQEIPAEIREMLPESDSENDEKLLKLIHSIAPSIFGAEYDNIKLALLLQAVSGVSKEIQGASYRGDIHVLLIGDPGVSKSQLLKFMTQITPRSIYTSGKGTSSAGLTALVQKDENGEYYLEQGALVLADQGLVGLDEMDKLSYAVRAVLHECMEQQTVSIAKAGIVAQLKARTSILAAANPVDSKYNVRKTVVQNINMDPSLLSRFDLIFLLLDDPTNQKKNQDLATHLLSLYFENNQDDGANHYEQLLLRRYINLVKQHKPEISNEAQEQIIQNYLQLRKQSDLRSNRIAALPRQLLSLIRLAEARAKLRLGKYVTVKDVSCAFSLVINALKVAATNENGVLDMRLLNGGAPEVEGVEDAVKVIIRSKKSLTVLELSDALRAQGMNISLERIEQILTGLVEDQLIRKLKGQVVLVE